MFCRKGTSLSSSDLKWLERMWCHNYDFTTHNLAYIRTSPEDWNAPFIFSQFFWHNSGQVIEGWNFITCRISNKDASGSCDHVLYYHYVSVKSDNYMFDFFTVQLAIRCRQYSRPQSIMGSRLLSAWHRLKRPIWSLRGSWQRHSDPSASLRRRWSCSGGKWNIHHWITHVCGHASWQLDRDWDHQLAL